jgi:transcriptional regulator with XRE-family HTH domain
MSDIGSFSTRLAEVLDNNRWNQAEAAEILGISQAMVRRYLSGKRKPLPRTISFMAERVGVSPEYLSGASSDRVGKGSKPPPRSSPIAARKQPEPWEVAFRDLQKRWKRKPEDRESIRHLLSVLFPKHEEQITAVLEKR